MEITISPVGLVAVGIVVGILLTMTVFVIIGVNSNRKR